MTTDCTCECTCGAGQTAATTDGLQGTLERAIGYKPGNALNGADITESVAQALGTNTTIEGQNR